MQFEITLNEAQIEYLLNILEPLAVNDKILDDILDQFDSAAVVEEE